MRYLLQFADRKPAAIRGSDQRAHTGAGDHGDGYAFFFEDFENANVRDAAGKATAEREPTPRRTWDDFRMVSSTASTEWHHTADRQFVPAEVVKLGSVNS